ncbi:MAG: SRPBCC family protein [Bacteroidales bacterium]|nr:SRPBCC family protein [Bacteroidales bacterium]
MLKKIFIFIIAFFAMFLIIAALLPAKYRIERSITINAPQEKIFWQIADIDNYTEWNPWLMLDPNAQKTLSETRKGVGASWLWEGEKIGAGKLSIINIKEFESIETKVEFFKPWKGLNYGFWSITPKTDSTKVTWAFEGKFSYPFERFLYFYIDDMMGKDFEKGLDSLKKRCENE